MQHNPSLLDEDMSLHKFKSPWHLIKATPAVLKKYLAINKDSISWNTLQLCGHKRYAIAE